MIWVFIQLDVYKGDSQKIRFLGLYNSIYIKVTPHVYCAESTVWSPERCLEGPTKTGAICGCELAVAILCGCNMHVNHLKH